MALTALSHLLLLLNLFEALNILVNVVCQLLPEILDIVVQLGGEQDHQVHQLLGATLGRTLLLIGNNPCNTNF